MHFLSWVLEQADEPGDHYAIANILYTDINNGCMPPVKSVLQIKEHFSRRHPSKGQQIVDMITNAFVAYVDRGRNP